MKKTTIAVLAAIALSGSAALAAPAPADKCEAAKNKAAGTYYACREKAAATAATKGGSPDFSKCTTKFTEKWDAAETAGAGACPDNVAVTADVNAYIAGQADAAAAIVAGTSAVPTCGDGQINKAGEHCDGAALDGYSCESFGLFGTFGCTAGCDFDVSGCAICSLPGVLDGGNCWVLGAIADSCDTACASIGLAYDDATRTVAGSDGTDARCIELLDTLGATGTGLDSPSSDCSSPLGCSVYSDYGFRARCATPPTDAATGFTGIRRVCACH